MNQNSQIAIIHYAAPPVVGGVESTIEQHALRLAEAGYRVKVIAGQGGPLHPLVQLSLIPEIDSLHPRIVEIGRALEAGNVPPAFYELRSLLVDVLKRELNDCCICIAHNLLTLHKNLPLTAALYQLLPELNRPLAAWCHDFAWQDPLYTPVLHTGYPWDLLRQPWPSVRYVTVSKHRRKCLADLFDIPEESIEYIPPGIDPISFYQLNSTLVDLVKRLNLLEADPLILLPARITRRKNLEFALRMTACLKKYKPQVVLLVTGPPGPHNIKNHAYLQSLKKLREKLHIERQVFFLYEEGEEGQALQLSSESISGLFRLADLLFFPSHREGFGIPVLEAGLARLPVFAAHIDPFLETAGNLANYFDPDGDPAQVAQSIAAYLENERAYALKRQTLTGYNWETIFNLQILPLIKEGMWIKMNLNCSTPPKGRDTVVEWFSKNTYHSHSFDNLHRLVALKRSQGLTISLGLPTLNEEDTIGEIIRICKKALVEDVPLVDEIAVIDSGSDDHTCQIASSLGVPVYLHPQILPEFGSIPGKGEALWKSLAVLQGDLLVWVDTDTKNFQPRFVYGLLGPLLEFPNLQFVKGFYRRPIYQANELYDSGGGRVTELLVRPFLNLHFPELSGFIQPLSGEYAGRRSTFERLPFFTGYGVEIGLLIDLVESFGLENTAQIDLLVRIHRNRPLSSLSQMSFSILQVLINRLEKRCGSSLLAEAEHIIHVVRQQEQVYKLEPVEVEEWERPPIMTLPAYLEGRRSGEPYHPQEFLSRAHIRLPNADKLNHDQEEYLAVDYLTPESRIQKELVFLYGESAIETVWPGLEKILARFRQQFPHFLKESPSSADSFSERDSFLITYADQIREEGRLPLQTLDAFLRAKLDGILSGVHLLPFYPYTSDDGFSVRDYRSVRGELGSWEDIQQIGQRFSLVFDAVVNHVSSESQWFKAFKRGEQPYKGYFIELSPNTNLETVVRPRTGPPISAVQTLQGVQYVWTTFSKDQVDLNYTNPQVLLEILDLLLFYVGMGAAVLRLDAVAFLWKEPGTPSFNQPESHALVRLFRAALDAAAPQTLLLTETNVPEQENLRYLGQPLPGQERTDEAQLIYQFTLPPLLLHAFYTADASILNRWAASIHHPPEGATFLNFTASHDGIMLMAADGLLDEDDLQVLVEKTQQHGGLVSYKSDPNGSKSVYELNTTWYDALNDPLHPQPGTDIARFLASQAVMLSLKGVPGIYFHSLFGTRNCHKCFQETGLERSLNRQKFTLQELIDLIAAPDSIPAQVFNGYKRLLQVRNSARAFHPAGKQSVLSLGRSIFNVLREAPDGFEKVLCLVNLSAQETPLQPDPPAQQLLKSSEWRDLITGKAVGRGQNNIVELSLQPYETLWLQRVSSNREAG
jgi:glucosylglycerate phosphorylase